MFELVEGGVVMLVASGPGKGVNGGLCHKGVAAWPEGDPPETVACIGRGVPGAPANAGELGAARDPDLGAVVGARCASMGGMWHARRRNECGSCTGTRQGAIWRRVQLHCMIGISAGRQIPTRRFVPISWLRCA